jgi:hypothetical protein
MQWTPDGFQLVCFLLNFQGGQSKSNLLLIRRTAFAIKFPTWRLPHEKKDIDRG